MNTITTRRMLLCLTGLALALALSMQGSRAMFMAGFLTPPKPVLKLPVPQGGGWSFFATPTPMPQPPSTIRPRASTVTVTNLDDTGPGSLRQAILTANAATGGALPATIQFNIPRALMANDVFTIAPASALPPITNTQVTIDGTTQTANVGDTNALGPEVVIDGINAGAGSNGLTITGGDVAIQGLVIHRFSGDGIHVRGTGQNSIRNNFIGTDATGALARPNGGDGIDVGAPDVAIGGVTGFGNVISGNTGNGVLISGAAALRWNLGSNFVGTNALGTAAVGNGGDGVAIGAGAADGVLGFSGRARNVISGNAGNGVSVSGIGTNNTAIGSNLIGVDTSGDNPIANGRRGVLVQQGAAGTRIGDNGFPNVISGNNSDGIALLDAATTSTVIASNMIGVDDSNTTAIGNDGNGILVNGANSTAIGGAGLGNTIRFSGLDGVRVQAGNGNGITNNIISDNGRLGINLVGGTEEASGVTANDLGDADSGPNNLQNAPVITGVYRTAAGTVRAFGTLNSRPNTNYNIEFYRGSPADASGHGEGPILMFSVAVTTNASGNATFTTGALVGVGAPGAAEFVSATATDTTFATGETSEFSNAFSVLPTFEVDTLSDANLTACTTAANDCSLRGAINNSNGNADRNAITFNIPTTGNVVLTIAPASALPAISNPVVIDGYTNSTTAVNTLATGNNAAVYIRLDGGSIPAGGPAVSGLDFSAGNSSVRGLMLTRFSSAGIHLRNTGTGNSVTGCFIGTDGAADLGNVTGIVVDGANNTIGGPAAADRNLVSGNDNGIVLNGANNSVRNNYVGTARAGTAAIANTFNGIYVLGSGNTAGGTAAGEGNLVSGNGSVGVLIQGVASALVQGNIIGLNASGAGTLPNANSGIQVLTSNAVVIGGSVAGARNIISGNGVNGVLLNSGNNTVQGNYIGTDITGTVDLGNSAAGVLSSADGDTIGGAGGARNLISGNGGPGVAVWGSSTGVLVQNNLIGTNAAGTGALGNSGEGVQIDLTASNVLVGGVTAGLGNVIAHNTQAGIGQDTSSTGTGNQFLGNSIFSNGGLGIDLGAAGVTPNDANDTDSGPNNLQNAPEIGNIVHAGGLTVVNAALNSTPNTQFRIELFRSTAPDPSGSGEGQVFVEAQTITTDATGNQTFSFSPAGTLNDYFSLTATRIAAPTDTSEFSVALRAPQNFTVDTTSDANLTACTAAAGDCSLRGAITNANANAGADIISFDIPGAGIRTITVPAALPIINGPITIDGCTQAGSSANTLASGNNAVPLIRLDGPGSTSAVIGLEIEAPNSAVRGLIITRFREGVHFGPALATGNVVEGCFIGTDSADTTALGNGIGVRLHAGANGNFIGGAAAAQRNVISGNNTGIQIHEANTTANTVLNNYIGTNKTGTAALANNTGVQLGTTGNTIGSTTANAGNLISGNTSRGISDVGDGSANAVGNTIIGNIIGLNIGQNAKVGNNEGIVISSRDRTRVGSLGAGRNVVAGNTLAGITVFQNSAVAQNIIVQGNRIGTNTSGATGLGNGGDGIFMAGMGNSILSNTIAGNGGNGVTLSNASNILVQQNNIGGAGAGVGNAGSGVFLSNAARNNVIGGDATDTNPQPEGNFIAGNAVGVNVFSGANDAAGNSIRGNTIENNTGLGIDLRLNTQPANTPTLNDLNDADTGNNNLQNFPVITTVNGATISGTLNSEPNTTFALDFYDNTAADASGYGEGSTGLGQTTVTTDSLGNANFSYTAGAAPAGVVSATATNQTTGDTSEFSLTAAPATGLEVDTTSDANLTACTAAANDCSLRGAINRANADAGADTIRFNIPGAGVQTIAPATDLPALSANQTTIDGSTQPGWAGRPVIVIAPTGANRTALTITGAGNTVHALALNSNFVNLLISGTAATGNTVTLSHIGLNAAGTAAVATGTNVRIAAGAKNNRIGVAGSGNYIAGATTAGVLITGAGTTGNVAAGNSIGVDGTGNTTAGNGLGVWIQSGAQNNTIGGATAVTGNLISGNTGGGVAISDNGTSGNIVSGNTIGLSRSGARMGNGANGHGVAIQAGATGNSIGGTAAGARNIVSGNGGAGVSLQAVSNNTVQGNHIGTNAAGTAAIANLFGVTVNGGSTVNTIGGTAAGARNVISGNQEGGISIEGAATAGNIVTANYVGLSAAGTAAVPNGYGIGIFNGAKNNTIGGGTAAARNVVSGNTTGGGITINGAGSTGNTVQGNYVGLNAAGTGAVANRFGVGMSSGASSNQVGGLTAAARNVISGNTQSGVAINGAATTTNIVQGNYLGTNAAGNGAIGGQDYGVAIDSGARGNTIGGTASGAGNLLSGNLQGGVYITDTGTSNNTIAGNTIGLTAGGAALGNGPLAPGIYLFGGSGPNTIGGSTAGRNTIAGNGGPGVRIEGSNANIISSNYIGTNAAGNAALANGRGVVIENGANNLVGGASVAERNVLAAGEYGVLIAGTNATANRVQGNYIGTNAAGAAPSPNTFGNGYGIGIFGGASGNTIGGAAQSGGVENIGAPPGNLISGNVNSNIHIEASPGNIVTGNLIGTNAAGTAALGNFTTTAGVTLQTGATGTVLGRAAPGERNVISGNAGHGILLQDPATTGNSVLANYIGVGANGAAAVGNGGEGINVANAPNNTIGGLAAGTGNLIRNNTGNGVCLFGASGVLVRGNSIDGNGGLAIDFDKDGPTANDDTALDADTGPNALQNHPVLTQTGADAANITVRADLITVPNSQVVIDLYSSPAADGSGFGEGRTLQSSSAVLTANATTGAVSTTFTLPRAVIGQSLAATATNTNLNNTSEFGPAIAASDVLTLTVNPAGFSEAAGATAATATVTRSGPTTAALTVTATSSDTSKATAPAAGIVIPIGATSVDFPIAAVDDAAADGTQNVVITVSAPGFADATANLQVFDDEGAGFNITPSTGLTTTEAGGTATFTVSLATRPLGNVTLPLASSDTTEGTVAPASLTFTPANFATPQTVTVTGVDDQVDDGDIAYSITTGAATSTDPAYTGRNPADVSVRNLDNDTANVLVNPVSGLVTTESGGTATFTVHLNSQPTANVTINLASSDAGEGTVSPATLVFTPANYATARTVTVTGVNDVIVDGDQAYTIITTMAAGGDALYNGINPADVAVTNRDNDSAGLTGLLAWGYNTYGQLGDGSTNHKSSPTLVNAFPSAAELAAGGGHSVTRGTAGPLSAAGYNAGGQLGDGTFADKLTPVTVNGVTQVTAISTGWYHTLALRSDGTVWAWGSNGYGQLGDGTLTSRATAVQVPGLADVIAISGGVYHSVALLRDGTLRAWGNNFYGQLGDGTVNDSPVPVVVQGIYGVTAISAGGAHTAALVGGEVFTWGWNDDGQLGDNSNVATGTPTLVQGVANATKIASGYAHTLALTSGGTLMAWGNNNYGQLGDGSTNGSRVPVAVTGLTNVNLIAAGAAHNLAVKTDGTAWAWGNNAYGSLGDGTNTNRSTPLQVPGIATVRAISAGYGHSLALGDTVAVIRSAPIVLSGLTARVSQGTVALAFTGALDAVTATDVGNYDVSANGTPLTVTSASYNPATFTVTLKVDGLFNGAKVRVKWHGLRAADNRTIASSEATTTAAK